MKQAITLIGFCLVLSQSLSANAQEVKNTSSVDIPKDAIDHKCELTLNSGAAGSTITDAGRIVRFDGQSVVLVDVTRTVRVDKSVPILSDIPYLGRMFSNVGVGVEKVPGELSIDRREIKSVKVTK